MASNLEELACGMHEQCDLKVPSEPPEWLDKDKYLRGRKFFMENALSVYMSNFRNLVIGLSVPNLCQILVLTGKSETRKKAFWRYVDTGYYMNRWLLGLPPWEDNSYYKTVNGYHNEALQKFRHMTRDELESSARTRIENLDVEDKIPLDEELDKVLLSNIEELKCTRYKDEKFLVYKEYLKSDVIFSQLDMALVQIAFFASIIMFPKRFGAGNCSETSLEDFLYMWKVIGYYLGVKDNFNPVLDNISETKALLWEIGHQIIIPAMLDLDTISIHMAKCITQAYRLDYHLAVYSNCYNHGIELKKLWLNFSISQKCQYYWKKIIFEWIYALPLLRQFINRSIFKMSERIHAKRLENKRNS